jgi:hypothetical protein
MPAALLRALLLVLLVSTAAACRSTPPSVSSRVGPAAIDEPVAVGPRVTPNASLLPPDARVEWPAFDGDSFWVSLPDTAEAAATPAEVRARYVTPFLGALGIKPDQVSLVDPPAGIEQPAGSPDALVNIAAARAARTPALARPGTGRVVAALQGKGDPAADAMFERAEGRTRAAALADLGRREVMYPFLQVVNGVPVEYTAVLASRREGRSVHALRGAVLAHWTVVNAPTMKAADGLRAAIEAVGRQPGLTGIAENARAARAALVLLPYGRDGSGRVRLHHSYRVNLTGDFEGLTAPIIAWVDAHDLALLKLRVALNPVAATGLMWARDPRDPVESAAFDVDAPSAVNGFTLTRSGTFNRLDFRGDNAHNNNDEVSISGTGAANFAQPPDNDAVAARCGANKKFQQIHVFATLSRLHHEVLAQGIYAPYPQWGGFTVSVEHKRSGTSTLPRCSSWAGINVIQLGACEGYTSAACPDAVVSDLLNAQLNHAHDVTMVAHEFGHTVTEQLTSDRPPDWCGAQVCPYRGGLRAVHELADFWAAHFTWTNCIGGWVGKNVTGLNRGRDCDPWHHPDWALPRKLSLPDDRFPEVRTATATCSDYCEGQTAGAALWEARLGARSRSPLLGVPEFGVRLQAALRNLVVSAELNDASVNAVKIYRLHQGVLRELAAEYASSSNASLTQEILSGFARAGIFLAPYDCVTTAAASATTCRRGAPADAVIDVDDRNPGNDPVIAGVRYRQTDYLSPASAPPTFQVWTGPRYRLDLSSGAVNTSGTARCHKEFIVELSADPAFPATTTVSSGWKTVSTTASSQSACQGVWTPTARLPNLPVGTKLYYRARTRKGAGALELVSTQPGAGLIGAIPPPFLLLTADGLPEF